MRTQGAVLSIVVFLAVSLSATPCVQAMPSDADSNTYQMARLVPTDSQMPAALGIGASGDFIFQRDLEDGEAFERFHVTGANIYFDPIKRLHLNLLLGAAQGELAGLKIELSNGAPTTVKGLGKSDTAFAMAISGKVDVVEFPLISNQPKAGVFLSSGYRFTNPNLETAEGDNGLQPTVLDMSFDYQEWQVAGGLSQRFDNVLKYFSCMPYIGMKYSDLHLDLDGTSSFPAGPGVTASIVTGGRNSDRVLGLFFGLQILARDRLSLDLEGRYIDETAFYLNGRIRL